MRTEVQERWRDLLFYLSRRLNLSLTRPDWVSINLTLKCNLKCRMCRTCYDVPRELSLSEIKDIIDQVSLWKVLVLNPLGGEPFMRRDIVDILKYATSKDFYISLTTNATLFSPMLAREVCRIPYNRLHFNFSLDGFRKENDDLRGRGVFDRVLRSLDLVREYDRVSGNSRRKVLVNTIINDRNIDYLPEFMEYLKERGFDGVQYLNLFIFERTIPPDVQDLWIGEDRLPVLDRTIDRIMESKGKGDGPGSFEIVNDERDLLLMKDYYRRGSRRDGIKCWSGFKELYINSDGRAIMCDGSLDFLKGDFGNVRTKTLRQLWLSGELRALRRGVLTCEEPCIQDCYLRRESDSLATIARSFGRAILEEMGRRFVKRKSKHPLGSGTVITLELTDACDLSCGYCYTPPSKFRSLIEGSPIEFSGCYEDPFRFYMMRDKGYLNFNRGFMDFAIMKGVVEGLIRSGSRPGTLLISWRGEPLLHPQFVPIYRYLLERWRGARPFGILEVQTNATLLNTEVSDILVSASEVPQRWIFNLDAGTAEGYRKVKGRDLWSRVLDNINYLMKRKGERGGGYPSLVFQFTVAGINDDEAHIHRDVWLQNLRDVGLSGQVVTPPIPGGEGDFIFFRRLDFRNPGDHRRATEIYRKAMRNLGLPEGSSEREAGGIFCPAPFIMPHVSWDGKVTFCPVDYDLSRKIGEVTKEEFTRIWWEKEEMNRVRRDVSQGSLERLSACRDCPVPLSPNLPDLKREEVVEFFRERG